MPWTAGGAGCQGSSDVPPSRRRPRGCRRAAGRAGRLLGRPATRDADRTGDTLSALRLVASVAQFRFDEGTRNLKAGVTNDSDEDIRVSQATIAWDGFAFPTVPVAGGVVHPGQTAAFSIAYGAPECPPRHGPNRSSSRW